MSLKNEKEAISDDQLGQISGGNAADWRRTIDTCDELSVMVHDDYGQPLVHQKFQRQKNGEFSQLSYNPSQPWRPDQKGPAIDSNFLASILDSYSNMKSCGITGKLNEKGENAIKTFKRSF